MYMEEKFEQIISAPSVALERGIDATKRFEHSALRNAHVKRARGFWNNLGPGLITGASDDDPSGIATYSQTGAQYGFLLKWKWLTVKQNRSQFLSP